MYSPIYFVKNHVESREKVLLYLKNVAYLDRKSTRLNSSHSRISYAVFCLKKKTLCAQVGGVSSPQSLLTYLHNLGVVFYNPPLFHDRIILDQSWALAAVYAVFDLRTAYPL